MKEMSTWMMSQLFEPYYACDDLVSRDSGAETVPVADCGREEFSAHPKQDWTLSDYLKYLRRHRETQDTDCECRRETQDTDCECRHETWDTDCECRHETRDTDCECRHETRDTDCECQRETRDTDCECRHETRDTDCECRRETRDCECRRETQDSDNGCQRVSQDTACQQDNQDTDRRRETRDTDGHCRYLKDWHFTRSFPEYQAYSTPVYFRSDWLNEFWDTRPDGGDDYRFVYIGPKGSWTPLHADVFRSYSWSANICGRKKWILFAPGEERCLTDTHGQLAYDVTSESLLDESLYPLHPLLQHQIEIIQEAGEVVFIPSGWYHQVHNMEDTISVNHNWMNGCNIDICWDYIKKCLQDVQKEIADCREMDKWHIQCQVILKASSGIDFKEFLELLLTIADHRLRALGGKPGVSGGGSGSGGGSESLHTTVQSMEASPNVQPSVIQSNSSDTAMPSCKCGTQDTAFGTMACTIPHVTCSLDSGSVSEDSCGRTGTVDRVVLDLAPSGGGYTRRADNYEWAHWRWCEASHAKFDLARVRDTLRDILSWPELAEIDVQDEISKANHVLCDIRTILY